MRYLTANDRPGVHAPSLYAAEGGDAATYPPLTGTQRADVAVVGGGYAGLSAALHLAQAGLKVCLVEAHRVGWGASGRNGGQLSHGPRIDIRRYETLVGRDDARRVWAISSEATQLVRDLIQQYGIACALREGHLEAACRRSEVDDFEAFASHVAQHYDHDALFVLGRDEIRARVLSPLYVGGLEDRAGGHLDPLALARGLADAAIAEGVHLHEMSTVTKVDETGVETAAGRVAAPWVVLACNGYLDGLDRAAAARVMPINNFIVATAPLGARNPVPGGECVCDTRTVINYFRPDAAGRLIFGGGETTGARFPADIEGFVRRPLARVFPQLADVPIEHGWGGTLAITRHRTPLFHRTGQRLVIGGWSGAGVHMAVMGGKIAAEAVRGVLSRWDVLARVPCPPFPGGAAFRPALLALAFAWAGLRDRL